jgi:NADH:ubiquinone oxidoreductase subunit E
VAAPSPDLSAASPAVASTDEALAAILGRHGHRADALIEVLHQLQERHGHLSKPLLRQVARGLRLPLSRVYGVASFYHLFRLEPPSAHCCAVCLGTACFVRGGGELAAALAARLGTRLDGPPTSGGWSLQAVSCLGACGQAPVLVVDGALVPRLPLDDPQALAARLTAAGLPHG